MSSLIKDIKWSPDKHSIIVTLKNGGEGNYRASELRTLTALKSYVAGMGSFAWRRAYEVVANHDAIQIKEEPAYIAEIEPKTSDYCKYARRVKSNYIAVRFNTKQVNNAMLKADGLNADQILDIMQSIQNDLKARLRSWVLRNEREIPFCPYENKPVELNIFSFSTKIVVAEYICRGCQKRLEKK